LSMIGIGCPTAIGGPATVYTWNRPIDKVGVRNLPNTLVRAVVDILNRLDRDWTEVRSDAGKTIFATGLLLIRNGC